MKTACELGERRPLMKYLLAFFGLFGLLLLSMIIWVHQISQLPEEAAALLECADQDGWKNCIVKERGLEGKTHFESVLMSRGFRTDKRFVWPSGGITTGYERGLLTVSVDKHPSSTRTTAQISRTTWTSFLPKW